MKLKKVLSIALITALGVTMTACGSGKDATTTAPGGEANFNGKELTVGIWGGNDAESKAINQVKADFEKETGATVNLKVYTDYNTQIQADFIGKTAPDVFYVDGSMFPFYSNLGVMEPLDPTEIEADKYYPNMIEAFTATDGTLYCIPKDTSSLALYYNTDLLESVGMTEKDIPTEWEAYKEFLPDLQAKLDKEYGKNKVTAMTVNLELARNLHILERGGASVADENGNSTMNTDGVKKNAQFILDLTKTGGYKTPADIGLGWNGEVFGAGKAVLMDEGNWVYGTLKQDYSDIKFGVTDMPSYEGTKSSMAFTVGYGIYSGSKEKALAKEWIKYATGEVGMNTWCSGAGTLPSRDDVAKAMDVESDPVLAAHLRQVEYAVPWQKGSTASIIDGAYKNFIPEAVKGKITLDEAMEQIDKQANSEIENAQ